MFFSGKHSPFYQPTSSESTSALSVGKEKGRVRNSSKIMELKLYQPCSITAFMANFDLLQRTLLIYLFLNHWDWVLFQVANIHKAEVCHSP